MKSFLFKSFLFILVISFLIPLSVNGIVIQNPLEAESFDALIVNIIDFLIPVASAVAGLMIVVGAFYFVTSAGSPERVEKGKKLIFYALLGLIVVILAQFLVIAIKEALKPIQ